MEREQMPKTLAEHGDTLVSVNSVGKLKEWLDDLPIKQSEFDGVGAEEIERLMVVTRGDFGKKNQAWEKAIEFAGRTILCRAVAAKEIVWQIRPGFTASLLDPDQLQVVCEFRCAFVPKGE